MVEGRKNITAAPAAYLNNGLEPTAYSVRSFLAPAFGSGSGLALSRQESLASLAGCKSLSGKGEPPTRIESCVHGGVGVSTLSEQDGRSVDSVSWRPQG
jgi:hypothetical protein